MPLGGRSRRRLALTSVLNNPALLPDTMHETSEVLNSLGSTPNSGAGRSSTDDATSQIASALLLSGPSSIESNIVRQEQRKRRRIRKEDSEEHLAPSDYAVANTNAEAMAAGPSSLAINYGEAIPSGDASTSDTTTHLLLPITRTTQEQLQDRSKLLAAQEGNARLEARVVTLGKEVAFKNDVSSVFCEWQVVLTACK